MSDLMDERLSTAARRWQAAQPPPPGVPLERLESTPARQVGWRQARVRLVAAAAVLVVGVTVAVTRIGGWDPIGPSSSPSHVQRAPQIVPWRDLKAQHLKVGHREHGHTVTPFDHVMAVGDIHGHLHPGDVLRFTMFLESSTTVSLDPCPDYTIAFGATRARNWHLNCAQVPHGVLPAGRRVLFEMRVKVPDVLGRQKVLWTLAGPTPRPGFYGMVRVTPR